MMGLMTKSERVHFPALSCMMWSQAKNLEGVDADDILHRDTVKSQVTQ